MHLPSYFDDFLQNIRLTNNQVGDCKRGHRSLRRRLKEDDELSPILVTTFLQGSYRRGTAVRPHGGKRADVDVIVVTRLSEEEYSPDEALELFVPFLDRYYHDKYEAQGRSFGIQLSYADLDLVVTSAPSESEIGILASEAASIITEDTLDEVDDWRLVKSWVALEQRSAWNAGFLLEAAQKETEWKLSPLRIPDREVKRWESTHPLAQIQWTRDKNQQCDDHYVNVVKAIKWWRRVRHGTEKYPKGYPVEHIAGVCCPDGIASVAEGVARTLETIVADYLQEATRKETPFLPDHGVPEHNVFSRVSGEDFAAFYSQVDSAAQIARRAYETDDLHESVQNWQALFGSEFPDAPPPSESEGGSGNGGGGVVGGYTPRKEKTQIGEGRFA